MPRRRGNEDSAIALTITPALTDTDGSETLTITISGIPDGAHLSNDAGNALTISNGSVTLTPTQLAGLKITPPVNSDVDFTLTVTATAKDGTAAPVSVSAPLAVTVNPVSDAPAFEVSAASGNEDSAIRLDLRPALTDTDGSEYLSAIRIEGLPAGATLNHGTHNADGSWTLAGAPDDPSVLRAQLDDLKLTPPANDARDFQLTVIASSQETSRDGAATVPAATTTRTIDVRVDAVADTPTLEVSAASGSEDGWIALDVRSATPDVDGSETLAVLVTGLPDGAVLNHGTQNADGSWTVAAGDLGGLAIKPPANSDLDFTIHLQAQTTETGSAIAQLHALSEIKDIRVTVAGVADTPDLTQGAAPHGNEDTRIALNLGMALSGSNETLGLVLTGVPEGSSFYSSASGGAIGQYDAATKSWSFSSAEIATLKQAGNGLYLQPPTDWSDWNTAGHSAGASITATLTASQTDPDSHVTTTADKTLTFTLHVDAVADRPTVTPDHDRLTISQNDDSGKDTNWLALGITPHLADTDGSEVASLTITGVPADARLNHGTKNGDGSWTVPDGQWADLKLLPGAHNAHDFTLTVTATATEQGSRVAAGQGTAVSDPVQIKVTVTGIAETPLLVQGVARGDEDTLIDLKLTLSVSDPSERLTGLTLKDVPTGSHFFDAVGNGHPIGQDDGNGTWSFSADEVAQIKAGGLYIQPPTDWSDYDTAGHSTGMRITAMLSAAATDPDSGVVSTTTAQQTLAIHVDGVADQPDLTLDPVHGTVGTAIALNIAAALKDTDGSETLTITIAPLPSGYSLSSGHHNTDGSWTLGTQDLPNLTLSTPAGATGSLALSITAQATEGHSTAETTGTLTVTLDQPPILSGDTSVTISAGHPEVAEHASVSDPDSVNLSALSIRIASGAEAGDRLTLGSLSLVEDPGTHRTVVADTNVEVSWDATTHQLTLHGTASTATYTHILQHMSMTAADGSEATPRTLEVTATDTTGAVSDPMHVNVQVVGDQITPVPTGATSADPSMSPTAATATADSVATTDHALVATTTNSSATEPAAAEPGASPNDDASTSAALDQHYTQSMALLTLPEQSGTSTSSDWTSASLSDGQNLSGLGDSWIDQSSHTTDPALTSDPLTPETTAHQDPHPLTPLSPELERVAI